VKILCGPNRGRDVTPKQWANNWITVVELPAYSSVLSPRWVQLTTIEEFERFGASVGSEHTGMFWSRWKLNDDGTFTDLSGEEVRTVRHSAAEIAAREAVN
jgi:hypothetical protein